jgi:K+-transporting ATPase ATPase C chain
VPADLVTASGGGLDPHISYDAAIIQVPRVATARGISEDEVMHLVDEHAQEIPLIPGVRIANVLVLNMALDEVPATDRQSE